MTSTVTMLEEVKGLVCQEMQPVSYKWLARKYGIPVNNAKQLLFVFSEQNRGTAKAIFLLAGWTKKEPHRHVVRLVDASKVLALRETIEPLTSYHIYSVQPSQPQDSAAGSNTDYMQLEGLFQELLRAPVAVGVGAACLADARISGVSCSAITRDASRRRQGAPGAAVLPPQASDVAAGDVAETVPKTLKSKSASAPAKASTDDGQKKDVSIAVGKSSSGVRVAGSKAESGSGHLSSFWSKPSRKLEAPPQSEALDSVQGTTHASKAHGRKEGSANGSAYKPRIPMPAADAEAALRAAQSVDDSSSEEDDSQPASRGRGERAHMMVDDDADESPAKPARRAVPNRRTVVEEISDEEIATAPTDVDSAPGAGEEDIEIVFSDAEMEAVSTKLLKGKKATAGRGTKRPSNVKGKSSAVKLDDAEDAKQGDASDEELKMSVPKAGRFKTLALNQGGKRRRVMKSYINDKGEEISELLSEDDDAHSAPGENQSVAPHADNTAPALDMDVRNGAKGKVLEEPTPHAGKAGSEAAKKPAVKKTSGAATAKASAKGKGATVGQRGIMSFFNKK